MCVTPCAVSYDLDRHLDNLDRLESKQNYIFSRCSELLSDNGEFFPFLPENLVEALGEIDIKPVAEALKTQNHEEAGKTLFDIACSYWLKRAKVMAEKEIEDEREAGYQ